MVTSGMTGESPEEMPVGALIQYFKVPDQKSESGLSEQHFTIKPAFQTMTHASPGLFCPEFRPPGFLLSGHSFPVFFK
jgi:hypothetical protein